MPSCNQDGVLAAHNEFRKQHGAPPLQWSDECMVHAQKCADENAQHRRVMPCFLETDQTERKMGQNIYLGGGPAENAVRYWYEENSAYDFANPGAQSGTGHFTQVVWYDTTHVGMARSACGKFIVANYFPAGNWAGETSFQTNVLPRRAPYAWRPRNAFEQRLAENFKKLARDGGDGMQVPLDHLVGYLQCLGERRLADAILANDADGDGNIHAGEFISALCTLRHSDEGNFSKELEADVRRIVGFVSVDTNGDGLLDEQEFLRYLTSLTHRNLSEQDARDLLKEFDADGNGYLDYMELMTLHDSGAIQKLNDYVTVTGWSREVAKSLRDVPLRDIVEALRLHLQDGGEARILNTGSQLVVKLVTVSSTGQKRFQVLEGSWDPATMRATTSSRPSARRSVPRGCGLRPGVPPQTR